MRCQESVALSSELLTALLHQLPFATGGVEAGAVQVLIQAPSLSCWAIRPAQTSPCSEPHRGAPGQPTPPQLHGSPEVRAAQMESAVFGACHGCSAGLNLLRDNPLSSWGATPSPG